MKRLLIILLICTLGSGIFAQNPDYELILKNDIQTSSTTYEFDIAIRPKAPTTSFELAQLQLIMTFNTGICTGTLSFNVISGTSDLNPNQQPAQANLSISGNELRIFPQTPPGAGSGTIINTEMRLARFTLTCSQNFEVQSANIAWKNVSNPYTKVWAYVSSTNTEITNSANHLNELSNVPLPVELSTFKVNAVEGAKAQLEWETASETNNYGFEIERSVVSQNENNMNYGWEKIGFVEGHGNSNSPKLYSFTDKNPTGGSKFAYRLKQIDIDGKFDYSDAVEVEVLPAKFELLPNYPNPFNPTTLIKFSLPEDTKLAINIYNILGEKVITLVNDEFKAGYHEVQFNSKGNGLNLSSGLYIYSIESKNFTQVKKMILMK